MTDLFLSPIFGLKPSQIRQGWAASRPVYGSDGKPKAGPDGKPLRHLHQGIDLACPVGTPIHAVSSGTIRIAASGSRSAGTWITAIHDSADGFASRYLHLSRLMVKPGQHVQQGDVIGLSGNTGASTGPHLHFDLQVLKRLLPSLQKLGLRQSWIGRAAPGCGGRVNVPVECFIRPVFDAKKTQGWLWLGEV